MQIGVRILFTGLLLAAVLHGQGGGDEGDRSGSSDHKNDVWGYPREINGHGSDEIGVYTVTGKYSTKTNEIELIKTYQSNTGDSNENLGHQVTIEVTWNPDERQFTGKWYVDTSMFSGEDAFELKFERPLGQLTDKKNDNP
ncbi:unnamed protein product [Rotaria sp. Silwood1]|nr:unnamed protein product [Rotaria sp. Silwood1]